jgi:catechol 2,3-dioxygenase-like lactoylglutathione lyase family enzyme
MIKALHTLIYSHDPAATRAFMRDVLGWPFVVDPGSAPDWLIFRSGPSEVGIHPTSVADQGGTSAGEGHHSVSLMCDDVRGRGRSSNARVRRS